MIKDKRAMATMHDMTSRKFDKIQRISKVLADFLSDVC